MEAQVCFDIDASTQKARHREKERKREKKRNAHSYTYEHTHVYCTYMCSISLHVTVIANALLLWP